MAKKKEVVITCNATNVKAVIEAVLAAKPATVKGAFIRSLTLSSTMGVGVPCILEQAE